MCVFTGSKNEHSITQQRDTAIIKITSPTIMAKRPRSVSGLLEM